MHINTGGKQPRRISAEQAAGMVRSGDWLDFGVSFSQPDAFDRALAARAAELQHVKIRSCISVQPRAVLEADPEGQHFFWFSWHFSAYDRRKHDAGIGHYIPCNLGEIPDYYRHNIPPVDIAVIKTCPMDSHGFFNFGGNNMWHRAVVERARMVIVEECASLPRTHGEQNGIHHGEVDFIIAGDEQRVPELPSLAPTDVDLAVGKLIASEIEDGACLQIGIGGMPNAVCAALLQSGACELGAHTEMLTDGIIDLYKAGLLPCTAKRLNQGVITYSFALGSQELYDTIDSNEDFLCCPVDYTNMPHVIMQNDRVVAINNTTQVDLQGQAASESDGHRHISGTGGQSQFVRGAFASPGGKAFICLASTYTRGEERRSRIVLNLTPGNIVTTHRSDMMYVVTEYGIVNLKGKSVAERAQALISIAHPDFQEELERGARENNIIPRRWV
jgi:acyl-CoA hydrolase